MCLYNLCIFVICVLIQSSLGDSIDLDHGGFPNRLTNEKQEYDYNIRTTNQAPVEDDKACESALLQSILGVIVTILRKDLSENAKTTYLLEKLKGLLKNTAAYNKEVSDKVDDLLLTLDKYSDKEPGDAHENSLRAGAINEDSPLRFFVKPKAQNEKLRFRYELPTFTNSYCTEALLNIAKIALQAYTSLSKNPICNLPGNPNFPTKIDTPTINPQISELPIPQTWDDLFPKNEQPPFNNGFPPDYFINKNPEQLVPNFDILNDLENVPVPSKEYDELILNQYKKRPQLNPVQIIDESYPLYPSDVNQAYNNFFPQRPSFNPYQPQSNKIPNYPFGVNPSSSPLNPFSPDEKPVYIPEVLIESPKQVDNPAELIFEFPHQKNPSEPNNSPLFPFNLEVNNPENPSVDLNIVDSKILEPDLAPFSKNPIHAYELEPIEIPSDAAPAYNDIPIPNEDVIYELNPNENPMQPPYDSIQKKISELIPQDNNYIVPVPITPSKLPKGQDLKVIGFIRDAIDVIEGLIPVVKFDPPTLYIIAKIKNILLNEDKDIEIDEYEAIIDLYKKLIDYVKQLNSYDQIIDRLDLSRVTNSPKLETKKVVELTYLVKRPQPVVYYPYYYVKYRLPYSRFVVAAQNILKEKPLRMDANQYEELLAQSKVIETSPDLKNYGKKDILGLVFRSGSLVNAKLIGENAVLTDHLDALKEITADLSAEEMLKLNKEARNKIKLFAADSENVNPYKNIIERSSPVESIENNGINEVNPIPKVLKRNQMLDIANPELELNSDVNQPTTEASFDSNKLRSTILRREQVGIPFSDHLKNLNLWQNPYLPSSSLPEQEHISPIMYKLLDATIDANLQEQNQLNIPSSGTLANIDNDKKALKTDEDIEIQAINISNPEFIINNAASVQNLENSGIEKASISNQKNTISASTVDELTSTSDLNNLWSNQQNYFNTMQNGMNIGSTDDVEQTTSRSDYQHLVYTGPTNEDIENFLLNPVKEDINQLDNADGVEKEITSEIRPNPENNDFLINTGEANKHLITVKTEELINNPLISENFIGNQFLQPSEFANQGLEHYDYQTGMEDQQSAGDEMNVNLDGEWVQKINSQHSFSKFEPGPESFAQQLSPQSESNNKLINQQVISDQIILTNPESISQVSISNRQNFKQSESNSNKQASQQVLPAQQNYPPPEFYPENPIQQNNPQPGSYPESIDQQLAPNQQNQAPGSNPRSQGRKRTGSENYPLSGFYPFTDLEPIPSQQNYLPPGNSGQQAISDQQIYTEPRSQQIRISPQSGQKVIPSQQNSGQGTMSQQGIGIYSSDSNAIQQAIASRHNIYYGNPDQEPIPSQQNYLPGSFIGNSGQQLTQGQQKNPAPGSFPGNLNQQVIPLRQKYSQSGSQQILISSQSGQQVIPSQQNSGQGTMSQQGIGIYSSDPSAIQQAIASEQKIYHGKLDQEPILSQQNYLPGSYTGNSVQQLTLSQQKYPAAGSFPGNPGQQENIRQKNSQSGFQQFWINSIDGQQVIPNQQSVGIYSTNPTAIQQALANQRYIYNANRGNYGQQGYSQVRATVIPFTSVFFKRPIIQKYTSYPVITRYTSPLQATYLG